MMNDLSWQIKTFKQLSTDELYDILKLRVDIFVVEQTCYYPELDEHDRHPNTQHVFLYKDKVLQAYLRVLPTGLTYDNYVSIGRVAIAQGARGCGLAHQLITQGLAVCKQTFPDHEIKISAQQHLEKLYQDHGFSTTSAMYLEDNIPHIAMLYTGGKSV